MPTILVVDDETETSMLLSTVLRQTGFSVVTIREGANAIPIAQLHHGDVALVITGGATLDVDDATLIRSLSIDEEPDLPDLLMMAGRGDTLN